ncbi:hypothetical protein U1Q18_014275, partial [Sarracenia purpurea var. burkii]
MVPADSGELVNGGWQNANAFLREILSNRVSVRKPNLSEVFDSGYEFLLHRAGEERGVFINFGYADALEEVE